MFVPPGRFSFHHDDDDDYSRPVTPEPHPRSSYSASSELPLKVDHLLSMNSNTNGGLAEFSGEVQCGSSGSGNASQYISTVTSGTELPSCSVGNQYTSTVSLGGGEKYASSAGSGGGQYTKSGIYVGRGGNFDDIKARRKWLEVACHPSVIFLASTICMTICASVLLSYGLTGTHWEILTYDPQIVSDIVAANTSFFTLTWLFNGKVPVISKNDAVGPPEPPRYLLPLYSGVWISCIDLQEDDFKDLQKLGYEKVNKCVDHLDPDTPKPTEARASWQHRMQNLAIACALVCLILLGAAIVVGLFGIIRPQISAVLVTGVIYVLSATFAFFTLTIVHFKHKNRKDCEPLDVWTRLIPELAENNDFRTARIISHGGSLQLAWAGSAVCVLASVMWILLSKMMRYNPISFST